MGRVAVATDSNSGITQKEAEKLGIRVLPMPFFINGELYLEDIAQPPAPPEPAPAPEEEWIKTHENWI